MRTPPSEGAALAERLEALAKKATPRRLYDDDDPEGYLESDRDFLDNNSDVGVELLNMMMSSDILTILAALRQPASSVVTAAQKRKIAETLRRLRNMVQGAWVCPRDSFSERIDKHEAALRATGLLEEEA